MKNIKCIFLLFSIFIIIIFPKNIRALEFPTLHYENAVIYDLTDSKVIYELNSKDKISIASLTKILTTITAIEKINNLDDSVIYTKEMASLVRWDASTAGLIVGHTYTYRDLLYASILPSGADATIALAISLNGSINDFVNEMNILAKSIGMTSSNFINVTGLDNDNHYSTIEDLLKLLKYSLNNNTFKIIYTTKEYTLTDGLNVKSTLYRYSNDDTSRIIGSKTGYTLKALLCMSAYFISNNEEYIVITAGTPRDNNYYNIKDILTLIDFIDNNYQKQILINKGDVIKTIPIKFSSTKEYNVISNKDITKYLPNDYDKSLVNTEYIELNKINLFTGKNTLIGKVNYYYGSELLDSENVYFDITIQSNKIILFLLCFLLIFILVNIFLLSI